MGHEPPGPGRAAFSIRRVLNHSGDYCRLYGAEGKGGMSLYNIWCDLWKKFLSGGGFADFLHFGGFGTFVPQVFIFYKKLILNLQIIKMCAILIFKGGFANL